MLEPLIDPFARAINYLRVSVTDRCDFRCTYCMSEDMVFAPRAQILTLVRRAALIKDCLREPLPAACEGEFLGGHLIMLFESTIESAI